MSEYFIVNIFLIVFIVVFVCVCGLFVFLHFHIWLGDLTCLFTGSLGHVPKESQLQRSVLPSLSVYVYCCHFDPALPSCGVMTSFHRSAGSLRLLLK